MTPPTETDSTGAGELKEDPGNGLPAPTPAYIEDRVASLETWKKDFEAKHEGTLGDVETLKTGHARIVEALDNGGIVRTPVEEKPTEQATETKPAGAASTEQHQQ